VLADAGYAPEPAPDAATALASVAERPPALILAAILPERTHGFAFVAAYRRRPGPHAPVALLTTAAHPEAIPREPPVAAVLRAPYDLADLLATVRQYAPPAGGAPQRG